MNTVAPSPPALPIKIKPITPAAPTPAILTIQKEISATSTSTPLTIPKQIPSKPKPALTTPKPSPAVVNQFSQNFSPKNETTQSQVNVKRRPAAPPPPPPSFATPNSSLVSIQQTPVSRGPLPPIPSSSSFVRLGNSPPLPPPRISSYIESVEQRFHFLPTTELPPPPQFIGFRKIYESNQRKTALMTSAH